MTGVVNSTGARTGVVGTTVGTPESTNASALSSGSLAPARMSTDTVLQTLYKQNVHSATDTLTVAASGTVNSTVYTMDIVSKQASSKFLVSLYLGFCSANGTDTEININQTIGGSTIILPYRSSSGDVGYGGGSSRLTAWNPRITQVLSAPAQSSGTTITFSAQFINWHASSTWVPYYNGSHVLMTIMEIAP